MTLLSWAESTELAIAAFTQSVQNWVENVITFMLSEQKSANYSMQQFLNFLEEKIDLYKLCCNLFASTSSILLFMDTSIAGV